MCVQSLGMRTLSVLILSVLMIFYIKNKQQFSLQNVIMVSCSVI